MNMGDRKGVGSWGARATTADARAAAHVPGDAPDRADWGIEAGNRLLALADATVHWPLAFDWVDADRDPRHHLRRLSILLSRRRANLPPEGQRRLGALLSGLRHGTGRSLVDAAADAGIDPVALALLEHGQLRVEEVSTVLLERLAWGFHTAEAHLASLLGATDDGVPSGRSPVDLRGLVAVLSREAEPSAHSVALLGAPVPVDGPSGRDGWTVLGSPLACVPVAIGTHGFTAAPTIRPDARRRAGFATVVAVVRDRTASPVADLAVRLAIEDDADLPGLDPSAVTDEHGVALITDVWLPDLVRCAGDGLRLPLKV